MVKGLVFERYVQIRPTPGHIVNVSQRVLSGAEKICRNLQKNFRFRKRQALKISDVATVASVTLIVAILIDLVYCLCTRKRKTTKTQGGFMSNSDGAKNLGIVVACFMVQITWPTSILEAVSNAEMHGISGCIFVAANEALVNTIFVLLLLEFRTKAPGARTIAQFVRCRFGVSAHILTIAITLFTGIHTLIINVNVGSMILDAASINVGRTAIVSIVFILVGAFLLLARRRSYGLILLVIITTILLIATFLISIVLNEPAYAPLGTVDSFYELLMCYYKPKYDAETSSAGGPMGTVLQDNFINFIYHMVRVLLDQALWETTINLPPNYGVLGLLLANLMAFCIPFTFGIVCGLGFRALESAYFNVDLLTEAQKVSGLMIFAVPLHLLNKSGILLVFLVLLLLVVTSCMFSILGSSSILYHDVLETYIRPFKRQTERTVCLLCGKRRGHLASQRNICRCRSMLECEQCHTDTWIREECCHRPATTLVYQCQTHGSYRAYIDEMSNSVLQIAFTVMAGMIPLFIVFTETALTNFVFFGVCTPFVGFFCLNVMWARVSRIALLIGYFVSAGVSLALWLVLEKVSPLEMKQIQLLSLSVALVGGFLLPVLITLVFTKPLPSEVTLGVWGCVQEIDNPLVPWPELFTRQTDLRFSPRLSERKPALSEVRRALASLRRLTYGIVVFNVVVFLGLWQTLGFTVPPSDFQVFFVYVTTVQTWTYLSTIFCLVFPLALLVFYQRTVVGQRVHGCRILLRHWLSVLRR